MPTAVEVIDQELEDVRKQLKGFNDLKEQEQRLVRARNALLGTNGAGKATGTRKRASAEEVADRERQALAMIREDSDIRPSALALTLGISQAAVQSLLNKLVDQDKLTKVDRGKYQVPA